LVSDGGALLWQDRCWLENADNRQKFIDTARELAVRLTHIELLAIVERERTPAPTLRADGAAPLPTARTAADLLARDFPAPRYAVEGLLAEGVSVLAGRPKLGKSWLALALSVAVAAGGRALGSIPVERGPVLYLALEDGERRLQTRLRLVLRGEPAPPGWHYQTAWPTVDDGGVPALAAWLAAHPDCRLVVIDTLKRIRPRERVGASLYGQDYDALAPLADLAREHRVCILVVHHTRKAAADDMLDMVSGSTGLTAAADAVLVLQRARGQADATLAVTGRDIEERELALQRDSLTMGWTLMGDAADYRLSNERRAILDVLRAAGRMLTPREAADALGKGDQYGAVKKLMWTMAMDGTLRSDGGRYGLPDRDGNGGNPVTRRPDSPAAGGPLPVTASRPPGNPPTLTIARTDGQEGPAVTAVTAVTNIGGAPADRGCAVCGERATHRNGARRHCARHARLAPGGLAFPLADDPTVA
jgi:hypothetical protein